MTAPRVPGTLRRLEWHDDVERFATWAARRSATAVACGDVGAVRHTRSIAAEEHPPRRTPTAPDTSREQVTGSLERVPPPGLDNGALAGVRDPSFPVALRGYDREAVEGYVARVVRVIDQLEATRSPDAAIRRALDEVGEETSGILQQARETASEITARSRAQADDRIREAEREARELVADAEARVRELDADFVRIWDERDRLLDEVRALAERLLATADDAEEGWEAPGDGEGASDTASLPALEPAAEDELGDPYLSEGVESEPAAGSPARDAPVPDASASAELGGADASPFEPPAPTDPDAGRETPGETAAEMEAADDADPTPRTGADDLDFDFGQVYDREAERSARDRPPVAGSPEEAERPTSDERPGST